ncbi:Acetyltransferase (GNAT) family protein [Thalassovita gelatinovora]|uniref:Acetyltransferase (GNAT) family protein n=2 Tax=Thalassovita gelatinovora TaxID=53501 RepID=A0A0P1FQW9_THAGE|nr:Acetyltransferase (GNAT) family protein [Thalassovita gelatinovora]SEQ04958.1 Protein N-acetyltransferase, RimJ/RimL family [Thalassovita gelatinovora]
MLETVPQQAVIETERFDLRPLRKSDKGLIEMHGGDKRVARFTRSIPHPLPPGAADAFIARALSDARSEDVWAIDGTKSNAGELMGIISLQHMDRDQSQIGYWVAPPYWNTGIASEAVTALIEANPQNCNTLFAEVFQDNAASARVLTNCGFEYLGDAETFSVARNAKVATWTYSCRLD